MKTEEQIQKAIVGLLLMTHGPEGEGLNEAHLQAARSTADVLLWVLNYPNKFGEKFYDKISELLPLSGSGLDETFQEALNEYKAKREGGFSE